MVQEEVDRHNAFNRLSLIENCGERVCLSKGLHAMMTLDAKFKVER
jgi:hypothetical protein